ncbi:MAG: hypothetical protein ACRD1D_04095 [Acidimicrobiales bacterium]
MGNRAAFGRPRALDRFRARWDARDTSFRANVALFAVVGAVALGLFVAALTRDGSRSTGLANATRPHLTTGGMPPATSPSSGLAAAGLPGGPSAVEASTSTTTTSTIAVAATVPPATSVAPSPAARAPATTVPPAEVTREVPASEPPPTTTPPPAPTTTVRPIPPTTKLTAPTTAAPTTSTTAPPLLRDVPLDVPLLPGL